MHHHKPHRTGNRGFTIVETMIVLAIASLILLIIFEAIPALERNSRNNQRRQDVQIVLQIVSRWELNNSGNIPDTNHLQDFLTSYGKMSYYVPANVTVVTPPVSAAVVPIANPANLNAVLVHNRAKCNPSGGSATNAASGYSDVVALYAIESGNGVISSQCQQL